MVGTAFKGIVSSFKKEEKKEILEEPEIEKVIKYLTPILEYDESYFDSMKIAGIKRKLRSLDNDNILKKGMMKTFSGLNKFS